MRRNTLVIGLLAGVACAAAPARADFYDGWRAHDKGDFAIAAREWRRSAQSGDARSQFRLGELYEKGRGVERDPVLALMWYGIAARRGFAEAGLAASLLVQKMTRRQIVRARALAAQWPGRGKHTDAPPKRFRQTAALPKAVRASPGPAARRGPGLHDGVWVGHSRGTGLCGQWRIPVRLTVSNSRITGLIDAGHIICPVTGRIDAKGAATAAGSCSLHTGATLMANFDGRTAKGSFGADAVDCSGRFTLTRVSK